MQDDMLGICEVDRLVCLSQFRRAIKYLGIVLGSDTININCSTICPEFIATAQFIGSLDCGLAAKVFLYNKLAMSELSYVAAFSI